MALSRSSFSPRDAVCCNSVSRCSCSTILCLSASAGSLSNLYVHSPKSRHLVRSRVKLVCEPTTHRSVLKGSSPPQHYPHECQPEPPLSTPVGGGSSPPCPSGAWLASDDRGRQSASATPVFPTFCEVSRMATGTRSQLRPAEETQPTTASTSPTGVTSATNRSDAPAV